MNTKAQIKSIAEYLGCNEGELVSEFTKLISDILEELRMERIGEGVLYNHEKGYNQAVSELNTKLDKKLEELK